MDYIFGLKQRKIRMIYKEGDRIMNCRIRKEVEVLSEYHRDMDVINYHCTILNPDSILGSPPVCQICWASVKEVKLIGSCETCKDRLECLINDGIGKE